MRYCKVTNGTFDITIGEYYGDIGCIDCNLVAHKRRGSLRQVVNFIPTSTEELIEHIKEHDEVGHRFPAYLIEELLRDDSINFPKD